MSTATKNESGYKPSDEEILCIDCGLRITKVEYDKNDKKCMTCESELRRDKKKTKKKQIKKK